MAKNPESPLEPFKRALVNATRSLAESPDLEIVYSGEGPQLSGNRAVLPHPPRDLTGLDAARIRGFADQMALRIAHHDPAAHARTRPATVQGQPIYDGIEQARLEAIGANAPGGVRENLKAVHEQALRSLLEGRFDGERSGPFHPVVRDIPGPCALVPLSCARKPLSCPWRDEQENCKGRRQDLVTGTPLMLLLLLVLPGLLLVYWFPFRHWFCYWGATDAEIERSMPGDAEVSSAIYATTLAVTVDAGPDESALGATRIAIAAAGRDVLAGRADHVRLNGIDIWRGGVHLAGSDTSPWRWDERDETLVS